MDLKSTSPSVTAGLPFTTIEGTPDGAPLKVAFILDPTLRPFQIQGFSLTMGIRVALQGFQIDCSADVLKKIRIGWVQTCEPNRQVEIRLPNGQSRTWVRTSLPFKDGSSVGLESPWYTEPWYPSQETYQAIYNSLAPGSGLSSQEKKERDTRRLKMKLAHVGTCPQPFADDPNFVWYEQEQQAFVEMAGYSLNTLADDEGVEGITILASGEDRFTTWLVAQDIQTNACQKLGAFAWTAHWDADISKYKTTPPGVTLEPRGLWHPKPSLAPRDLKTKVVM